MTTPPRTRLGNLNLLVSDVARSQRFYEEVFGLPTDQRRSAPPAMLILEASGCILSLKDRTSEDPGKRAGPGDIELGFETDDLEVVHAAPTTWGLAPGAVQSLGFGRTFDALDPDGHHLVVYTLSRENRS